MTCTAKKRSYPLKWLELNEYTPSGIFMAMGPEPTRFLIGSSYTNTSYFRTAIQLDETQDRPAFSFFDLVGQTRLRGVWMGHASARLRAGLGGSDSVVGPNLAGIIRTTLKGTWISCCDWTGELAWRRIDDLPLNKEPDVVGGVYFGYRLDAEAEDGTKCTPFETPREPTIRRPYSRESWGLDRDAAVLDVHVGREHQLRGRVRK